MLTLVGLTLVLLVAGGHCEDSRDPKDALRLSDRLDSITARIKKIEKKVDLRLSEEIKIKAQSLNAQVEALEEDNCDKDHFDCGGQDHECLSTLKVCDGRRDCRNGADEKHCENPVNASDVFIGFKVYDKCGAIQPIGDKIVVRIHQVKHYPAFTPIYGVLAEIKAAFTDGKETSSYGWYTKGYFSHSKNALILLPPLGESRGLKCVFDGFDFNTCHGYTASVGSLNVCAEYIYFRKGHVPEYLQKRHDHDDDDDDDDDHHYSSHH